MVHYIAKGSVRGACGHKHRTPEAAQRCADSDGRSVRRAYPSTYPTRAYSDRYVVAVEDGQERDLKQGEVEAIEDMEVA